MKSKTCSSIIVSRAFHCSPEEKSGAAISIPFIKFGFYYYFWLRLLKHIELSIKNGQFKGLPKGHNSSVSKPDKT
ncbi:hypothetical protein [Pedobacter mucosus]|uniref:hypothetical protein n=1 Tax=Pedobacter mucosus TaxID=2895286 RepID=UPI001EE48947|nr:hypothetical protein [Pedobacter mucosus]UKT63387.1 hypothetical protein LOK61_16655 [Pedobacter mucosus]